MRKMLMPDYDFETFDLITPDFLKSIGKKYVLCDIDNTVVAYDEPLPDKKVADWVKSLTDAGLSLIFISNNDRRRVETFCESLDVPYIYKSGKPSRKTVKRALSFLGGTHGECCVIGDQLLTDVLTARLSGVTPVWVRTIKKVETPFFRFKNAIEKPFINYYLKHKKTEKQ